MSKYDVHAISGVLKQFIKDLPDPIIPIDLYENFVQLRNRTEGNEKFKEELKWICKVI